MLAGMAAAQINAALGVEESAAAIFRHRTIESLAEALGMRGLDNAPAPAVTTIPRTPYTSVKLAAGVPLSPKQQHWLDLTQQLQADYPTFHIPIAFNLTGKLDLNRMQTALDLLAARHESLRLHICHRRQVVHPAGFAQLALVKAAGPWATGIADPTANHEWLQQNLAHVLLDHFDLGQAPLARAAVLQVCTSQAFISQEISFRKTSCHVEPFWVIVANHSSWPHSARLLLLLFWLMYQFPFASVW